MKFSAMTNTERSRMVIDTSALAAVLFGESDAFRYTVALDSAPRRSEHR